MNTILLQPTDVMFFRDGRPMTASLAGHGAALPLPTVINAAFHAALHRAEFNGVHEHRRGMRGKCSEKAKRDRKYGSLVTAGPFPVSPNNSWFFPRPRDLLDDSLSPALLPESETDWRNTSSLPEPLRYATASRLQVSKDSCAKAWLSRDAFDAYLHNDEHFKLTGHAVDDDAFCDAEHSIGIEIDPISGTAGQGETMGKFYSAHYLRLREGWRLGVSAQANDKDFAKNDGDLMKALLDEKGKHIIVGGQQRICTATRLAEAVPQLPRGINTGFHERDGKYLVKWVLLSPAVWPEILCKSKDGKTMMPHPGGWLPNWIFLDWDTEKHEARRANPANGSVRLTSGPGFEKSKRLNIKHGEGIHARLVAAIVPKPLVVTGWALPDKAGETDAECKGGACSTHLAVPAGAVYYFEADSVDDARKLADTLNWHGATDGQEIKNRRSTLLGEKGFGLGVCGTWNFSPKF